MDNMTAKVSCFSALDLKGRGIKAHSGQTIITICFRKKCIL